MADENEKDQAKPDRRQHFRPLDIAESRQIREQERRFDHDRSLNAGEKFVSGSTEFRHSAAAYSVEYAKIFINANILINAGAIVALLTFLGTMFGKGTAASFVLASYLASAMLPAFYCFAFGLLSIILCAALTYGNWIYVYQSWMGVGELMLWQAGLPPHPDEKPKDVDRFIDFTMYSAVFLGLSSTILFAVGCYKVLSAFSSLDVFSFLFR